MPEEYHCVFQLFWMQWQPSMIHDFRITTRGQYPHNSLSIRPGEQFKHYIERRLDGAIIDIKRFDCGCVDACGGWVLADSNVSGWGQNDLSLPPHHVYDNHTGNFLVHSGGDI